MTTKPNVMAEDAGGQAPASGGNPDEQQTVQIPLSAVPTPPKPGAMLQLKVVSVDANGGVINAAVVPPDEDQRGSDSLADEFNQQPQ